MRNHDSPPGFSVSGYTAKGFEDVRLELERNFRERGETGAACALFYRGEKVVDLWGGFRCSSSEAAWTEDTLALVFSVTKGVSAAAMAVAHSRGLFDLDAPVANYWPEFAQSNKQHITVAQLMDHQAGLITVDQRLGRDELADHEQMSRILARQSFLWEPGTRHGYHTLTLGWYQSQLLRRVDPEGRSLGVFFQEEIAKPLGLEFYIGLPETIGEDRLARTDAPDLSTVVDQIDDLPPLLVLSGLWPGSLTAKSIQMLTLMHPRDLAGPEYRSVEIPSANGIGRASDIAALYARLASVDSELMLTRETMDKMTSPMNPRGREDAVLKVNTNYSFGFSRPTGLFSFGTDGRAFGCPGVGGSFGMADPAAQVGYAYVTAKMGLHLFDDPREKAVRDACYKCLSE
jgi:CubicO group peptidase (beta-lactamase class C family)